MHYRVRYSLDFDPKIHSGQVCTGLGILVNLLGTSSGFFLVGLTLEVPVSV